MRGRGLGSRIVILVMGWRGRWWRSICSGVGGGGKWRRPGEREGEVGEDGVNGVGNQVRYDVQCRISIM